MSEPIVTPIVPKKRGRKSREEEARAYLRELGIDPDDIVPRNADNDPMPATDEAMLEEFKSLLWRRRHELEGTAFTQAINALARFAEATKGDADRAAGEPTVAEIILGNSLLPAERKQEILAAALAELELEQSAIVEALGELVPA